jgi:hypothetical protein
MHLFRNPVWVGICILFLGIGSGGSNGEIFDTDAITSGLIPAGVSVRPDRPKTIVVRAIREFAPCLRIQVVEPLAWEIGFGDQKVEGGKAYTFSVSLASFGKPPKGTTIDVANFRPENQAEKEESLQGKGYGKFVVMGDGKIVGEVSFEPTPWKVFTCSFDVPKGINLLRVVMKGNNGGLFFIADMKLAVGKAAPTVFMPARETLDSLVNLKSVQYSTPIKEGKNNGVYRPGDEILWTVGPAPNADFTMFSYKILDAWGTALKRGESAFSEAIRYKPQTPGYYEIVIRSVSKKGPSQVFHDYQGAAVISEAPDLPAGGNPFEAGSSGFEGAKLLGTTWTRGGIVGWCDEITKVTEDSVKPIMEEYKKAKIMPAHASNNIAQNTNSAPPGGMNELPKDFDAYGLAYKKLAGMGNNFVEHFEFWNEPEGRLGATSYWTIQNFTKALIAAHKGMKEANPKAKMGIGSNLELIKGVNEAGGQDAYEYILLHPYPWSVGGLWNPPEEGFTLEACLSARNWLNTHGGKDKEIWSTEFGYCTGPTISGCTELQQAQMDVRTSLLQLAGGLKRIGLFRYDDVWFWGQVDGRFGLTRGNRTPKPSFVAYGVLIRAVSNLPYQGRFDSEKNLAVLIFGNETQTAIPFWTTQPSKSFTLNLPEKTKLVDLFGKETTLPPGKTDLTADGSVKYIIIPVGYKEFTQNQPLRFLAGLHGEIFESTMKHKNLAIPLLPAPPTVDGNLDDWSGPAIDMKNPSQGFEAKIRLAFAGDFLYLMAGLKGDMPGKNSNLPSKLWAGDCIELYFTPQAEDRPIGFYRESDFHLGIAPGEDGKNGKIANIIAGVDPKVPGAEVRYKPLPQGGYDLEAKIPLNFFKIKTIKPGDRFGLDFQVGIADREGNRRWQETWSGNGQNYTNPFFWGEGKAVTDSPPYFGWTMGTFPDGLHNTPLVTRRIRLDETTLNLDFAKDTFAVVGGWIDNWRTFAQMDDPRLILGGKDLWNKGTVIWKIQAPPGNHFTGGTVSAKGTILGPDGKNTFLAVGKDLKLIGGGSYFAGFNDYNSKDFKKVIFPHSGTSSEVRLEIPSGAETFYIAITRDGGTANRLVVDQVKLESQLVNTYGLTLRYGREEPLWSVGEKVLFDINATGNPKPRECFWTLTRRNGPVCKQGKIPFTAGKAMIDLTNQEAGFYTLCVFDSIDVTKPLDRQEVVFLRTQDPRLTPETSIFGAFGPDTQLAKRMGVKWAATGYQWAWKQGSPKEPIQPPDIEYFKGFRENGIEPIVLIDTAPGWANGGKGAAAPPEKKFYPQWMAFNETAASTLKDCVTWFQTWNEPNNPSAFEFQPWDPVKVATRVKEIQRVQYRGLKKGNPNARLIGGCFAGAPAGWFEMWLTGSDSILKFQEAMSGHPYCEALEKEGYVHKRPPEITLIPQILAIRKVMDKHGAKNQPLFWTEYGWDTNTTSDEDYARWVARHQIIMQGYKEITKTKADCLFAFGSNTSYCIFYPAQKVLPGGNRFRPVIGAYATTATVLAGSKPLARISDYPKDIYLYAFSKDDETIYAAWATEQAKAHVVTLPLPSTQSVRKIGLFGEETALTVSPNQPIPLPENHDPVFFIVKAPTK